MIEVPLGELIPDAGDWANPGLTIANNCYAEANGYAPFYAASSTGDVTTEKVRGAQTFYKNDGSQLVAFGSVTRLGIRTSAGVTETTGYTSLGSGAAWRFARFGDYVIAVSLTNAPQYLSDIDSDTSWSALSGSPPNAAVVGRIGNQLFLGHVTESAVTYPNRLRWSALNNPLTGWSTDRGELSDFRDLPEEYGAITAIVGDRWGLVFQERAIWRAVFVGSPLVWNLEPVATGKGCIAPGSVVEIGTQTYFLSQDGFYMTDGSGVYPVSEGRVSSAFLADAQSTVLDTVAGTIDWNRRAIVWAYPVTTGGDYSRQLIYSLTADRWTTATEQMDYPVASQIDAVTLGDLGTLYPSGLGSMTGLRLGNPDWEPKEQTLGAFVDNGAGSAFAQFTGAARAATFKTGYGQPLAGARQRVSAAAALVDVDDLSDVVVSIAVRDSIGGTDRTAEASPAADSLVHFNIDGRYASFALYVKAGAVWNKATAFQVDSRGSGKR